MSRAATAVLAATALVASFQPLAAQGFFERLFGPPVGQPGMPPQPQPQYRQQPQFRPQPQPQPRQQSQPQRSQPQQRSSSQPQPQQPQQQAEPAPAAAEPPPAPYEKELLRLAEIMGSLALLRPLCAASDANEWSRRMQMLMEAEGTTPGRKERLAGAYNKGYQAFALTYHACTASAQEASNRYIREGELLARNIAGRYGG
ncbi:TIGR02301 family protein [Microvirga subterranea]|uniref:Uncharacterized protein (TIGR02301 family) n=1 Tax=Microvirga subterranea TaxID=186651 RepID=A0A370HHW1_9HYPH|nr:TIGR02301 family protein [Microvirga subterranea]RDI55069.1 uncharacterized protein (TIGR02301 family) [Microvirga subterranea]